MEMDMRGLSVKERKELMKWYLLNSSFLGLKGDLKGFQFLKKIEGKEGEFVKKALAGLFVEGDMEEGDVDVDVELLPKDKKEVRGYV